MLIIQPLIPFFFHYSSCCMNSQRTLLQTNLYCLMPYIIICTSYVSATYPSIIDHYINFAKFINTDSNKAVDL